MTQIRGQIILDFAKWTALSALRSGAPIKSRISVYNLLDKVAWEEVLQGGSPISQIEFDKWHEDQTIALCNHDPRVPIGWSTKLINVYLKTAAYVGELGRPGIRDVLHPPIDGGLWKGIAKRFPGRSNIRAEACCVQRIKDITEYSTYRRIIVGCRAAAEALNCPLIAIEQLWLGSATPVIVRKIL